MPARPAGDHARRVARGGRGDRRPRLRSRRAPRPPAARGVTTRSTSGCARPRLGRAPVGTAARPVATLRAHRSPHPGLTDDERRESRVRGAHDGRARRGRGHVHDASPGDVVHHAGRRPRGDHHRSVPRRPRRRPRPRHRVRRSRSRARHPTTGCRRPCARSVQPPGELVATIATANDVHFGETECGRTGDPATDAIGPILRAEPGEPPYPEVMSRARSRRCARLDPDAVVVKGDLTDRGLPEEYAAFLDALRHASGARDAPRAWQPRRDDRPDAGGRGRARTRSSWPA